MRHEFYTPGRARDYLVQLCDEFGLTAVEVDWMVACLDHQPGARHRPDKLLTQHAYFLEALAKAQQRQAAGTGARLPPVLPALPAGVTLLSLAPRQQLTAAAPAAAQHGGDGSSSSSG